MAARCAGAFSRPQPASFALVHPQRHKYRFWILQPAQSYAIVVLSHNIKLLILSHNMSIVRIYANNAERDILRTYVEHEVLVASYGCRQGPHTLTYALRLVHNVQQQLDKALKLGPLIEGAIRDTPVRIRHKNGYIYVEIPSPAPVAVRAQNLSGDGLAVPVGMTTVRSVRGIDFANPSTAHLVVVAGTGRGKTTAARTILYGLARQNDPADVRLVVCTFKPPDWNAFAALPHMLDIATEPRQIVRILRWAKDEVYRRSRAGTTTPRWMIVLDDMYNWGRVVDVGTEIGEIASLGRASGIHLLISTQKVTSEGVGNNAAAVSNISTRLVLGANSGAEAAQVTGLKGSGAELLGRYPGDGLLITTGSPVRLACAHVTDDTVRALAAGRRADPAQPAPWADLPAADARPLPQREHEAVPLVSLDTVASETAAQGAQADGRLAKPFERIDPPTPEQAAEIVRVFGETGGSINKTVVSCYGAKGMRTLALVHHALRQAGIRWGE